MQSGPRPSAPVPWHLVTGEYPPARGGVAEYTRSVARALAIAGDEVHVWAPSRDGELVADAGVQLHPLAHGFVPRGLPAFSRAFDRENPPRRLLLQYVPQAFGLRGMNLPFCAWIARLRETEVWVMFHEVRVRWHPWWRPQTAAMAIAMRAMAGLVAARADRTFVSTESWGPLLRAVAPQRPKPSWLPIPSNVPTDVSFEARSRVRRRIRANDDGPVIGHFGTYGSLLAPILTRALCDLLARDPRRMLLLLGRGGEAFALDLARAGAPSDRVVASGELEPDDVATHLAACDILLQPYPDGVTTRRTTVMAGLALGIPVASNDGSLTEPLWRATGAVELAAGPECISDAAEALLRDPARAALMGERGRLLYRSRFALEHTVRLLREPNEPPQ